MTYYDYLIVYDNGGVTSIKECENRMNLNEMESFIVVDLPNLGKRQRINLEHVLYIEETETSKSE
jgi:hypothetical protein